MAVRSILAGGGQHNLSLARGRPVRHAWVLVHRWIGLVIAGFLVVAGVTGALLAWRHELSAVLSPELYNITAPRAGAVPLDLPTLRQRAATQSQGGNITYLPLNTPPNEAVILYANGATKPEMAVDPYTGRVLARWTGDSLADGRAAVVPFLLRLHYSLALGTVGTWAFGIIALLWTLDTFVGAYLTFPARSAVGTPSRSATSWLKRWRRAWMIRGGGPAYKLNMDLHRAGGLWLWAMLFVFAWSSVGFNLNQLHTPVMRAVLPFREAAELPTLPIPKPTSDASWHAALIQARSLMAAELRERGLTQRLESTLMHDPSTGAFRYSVVSSADRADKRFGTTTIAFDSETGRQLDFSSPLDERAGDSVARWMYDLHYTAVWGRSYDIFVTLLGLAVAMLSGTGVYIWWKKHAARIATKHKRPVPAHRWKMMPTGEDVAAE